MAFYDYKCKKCGLVFEIKKGMSDASDPTCPECNSETQRIFSVPRTMGSESGACSTCSSGVCSTCGVSKS